MWSGQGPAFSFNCPAVFVLEFWSTRNECSIALPWQGAGGGDWGGNICLPSHLLLLLQSSRTTGEHLKHDFIHNLNSDPRCYLVCSGFIYVIPENF